AKRKEGKGKNGAPALVIVKKRGTKKAFNTLFEKRPKNFGIGQDKCPCYIQLKCPKVPPVILTTSPWPWTVKKRLLTFTHKHRPETKQEKKQRLLIRAEKKAAVQGNIPTQRSPVLQAGVNVTTWAENRKAQLVVIVHDADPIELAVFLPTLCGKMGAPYCIVKGKARLGCPFHRKTCSTVAFTQEDKGAPAKLVEAIRTNYNDRYNEIYYHWRATILDPKSAAHIAQLEKAKAKERATKQA
uniref:Ribosomal protein eL8/eL30/eS12/Gadd45 domain-containing protein n=1 Tax=Mustela putorius furo TaxID=9669 RepID=M3XZM5_MUSPF